MTSGLRTLFASFIRCWPPFGCPRADAPVSMPAFSPRPFAHGCPCTSFTWDRYNPGSKSGNHPTTPSHRGIKHAENEFKLLEKNCRTLPAVRGPGFPARLQIFTVFPMASKHAHTHTHTHKTAPATATRYEC